MLNKVLQRIKMNCNFKQNWLTHYITFPVKFLLNQVLQGANGSYTNAIFRYLFFIADGSYKKLIPFFTDVEIHKSNRQENIDDRINPHQVIGRPVESIP